MIPIRTAPFFKKKDVLKLYDEELRTTLEAILNVSLEGSVWDQCSLPVAKGGLGIRLASDLALPAFLASSHGAEGGMITLLPAHMTKLEYELRQEAVVEW